MPEPVNPKESTPKSNSSGASVLGGLKFGGVNLADLEAQLLGTEPKGEQVAPTGKLLVAGEAANATATVAGPLAGKTIAVVDDNFVVLLANTSQIEGIGGVVVDIQSTGQSAAEIAADIIKSGAQGLMTDFDMVGITGCDLIRALKESDAGKKIVCVVYSGREENLATVKALNSELGLDLPGAAPKVGFIMKPASKDKMVEAFAALTTPLP